MTRTPLILYFSITYANPTSSLTHKHKVYTHTHTHTHTNEFTNTNAHKINTHKRMHQQTQLITHKIYTYTKDTQTLTIYKYAH